jgi:type I restriction enzyme M protein
LRWSYWSQLPGDKALKTVKEKVFPFLKKLGAKTGSFGEHMETAEFKISKPSLLIEACKAVDEMQISAQNQDVQGDLYEYLLGRLNTAGTNGQFRTPRHIIRMMVQMIGPKPGDRIVDPAAGTCGFLVNAWQYLLETHTDKRDLKYDEEGWPHGLVGSQPTKQEWDFSQKEAFTGYDSDSGMTMLRIGSMNLMLHGLASPRFHYMDTLSKAFSEESRYDVVLANPPFKGAIDASDVNPTLPTKVKKTEILFLHLFLRLLDSGGRGAVIVPEGVLFGSSKRTSKLARSSLKKTASMRWSRCHRGSFVRMQAYRRQSSFSPKAQRRTAFGSMMWNTTDSHLMTSATEYPRTTFPTFLHAGKIAKTQTFSRSARRV